MWKGETMVEELDIYMIDFYTTKLFFQVARIEGDDIYLVELATKRSGRKIMLTSTIKPSKDPFIIKENNTYTKTRYRTREIKGFLPIRFENFIYMARPVKEYINTFWDTTIDVMQRPIGYA